MKLYKCIVFLSVALSLMAFPAIAQDHITSPEEALGFRIGDDYHLANYTQLIAYWKMLAQQSDRMSVTQIGITAEGRPMLMAIITSPVVRVLDKVQ